MTYIVGNWKMNGSQALLEECTPLWIEQCPSSITLIMCIPAPLLSMASSRFPSLYWGGQDCHYQENGAFTGDVSAQHLAETGATYVIVGHSERRDYHHETNEQVAKKAKQALQHGLIPIICVGESAECYARKETIAFLTQQLTESCAHIDGHFLIAYEPVWAIGTGKTATLDDIRTTHEALRNQCPHIPLLYGGSVNASNARDILSIPNVDGLLIGGASLKKEELSTIIRPQ